jgi:hypothetical protein
MKNNHPETLEIELNGETKTIKLGPAAFRLAEIRHKITFSMADLSNPTLATLAQLAYVGCLPDDPKLKETDFVVSMANSDEGKIISSVGVALQRMTDGLTFGEDQNAGGDDEGNDKPGK